MMQKIIEKLEAVLEWGGTAKDILCLVLGGLSLIVSLFDLVPLPFDAAWIAIILCGLPIILEAIIGLVTAFDIKADVLVSLALVASVCIGEDFAAGEVALIMQLGALLEELTVSRARAGIEKLVHLTPRTARVVDGDGEKIIPAEQVRVGDRIRILPGETIPVDGVIRSGQTSINQAVMTGESLPVDKTVGDAVSSGTVNQFGVFEMEATKVIAVQTVSDFTEQELYAYTAAVEQFSEHPLGKAIVSCYRQEVGETLAPAEQFTMIPSQGVSAVVNGKAVKAGNWKLLQEIPISRSLAADAGKYLLEGCTVIYVAIGDHLAGYLVLSDTVRQESAAMIQVLHGMEVQPVLLTGDNQNAANVIGSRLGIQEICANCLPEDKLQHIGTLQQQGESVCMIGDGINDAPALKKANVGIAMGGVGSDIAVDAADIALVDDEIKELPHLLALSKKMMKTIQRNLIFSMGLNFLAIALAITGILGPVVGALVHNAGSVVVILNSAMLLRWKRT